MKYLITSLLFLLPVFANSQLPCTNMVSQQQFNQFHAQVSHTKGDKYKLNLLKPWTNTHCLSCDQLKRLATLLDDDFNRLDYIQIMSGKIVDAQNRYQLLDAFRNFSTAFMLYDFFRNSPVPPPVPPPTPLPSINFPLCNNYNGPRGCELPLTDIDFDLLTVNFSKLPNDNAVKQSVTTFAAQRCISMAHMMKLAMLLQLESDKLSFCKNAFKTIFDMGNFQYAAEIFSSQPYKNDWMNYCSSILNQPEPAPTICSISENEMSEIKKSINNENSASVKTTLTKQILASKKCFMTSQIKQLVQLQTFESGKLDVAKFGYDFCTDRANYYQVTEAFSFSSSKEELLNYIKSKE